MQVLTPYSGTCAGALLLALVSAPAAAQQVHQGVAVPTAASNQERSIEASVGVSTIYDTNAPRVSAARAATLGLEKEDVTITPNLDVAIVLPFGSNVLTVDGDVAYRFHVNNTERDGEHLGLASGLASDLGPCRSELGVGLRHDRSELSDLNPLAAAAGLIDNFETRLDTSATLSCGAPVGLRPFVSVGYNLGRNSETQREISDYNTVSYGGGLAYWQPTLGELGAVASIEETDYPERPASLVFGQPGFTTKNFGVYFKRAIARTLQARVQVNYTKVDVDIGNNDYDGITGDLTLRIVPDGRIEIELSAAREVGASLSNDADYRIETIGGIRLTAPISPKLQLNGNFTFAGRDFVGSRAINGVLLTDDEIGRAAASLDYLLGRRIRLSVGAGYQWRRANDPFYNYDSTQVSASISLAL